MSKESSGNEVRNDEIDLLDLFRRTWKGFSHLFRSIGRGIIISIIFLFRKWIPLSISLIIAVLLSYIIKFTAPAYYSSDMIIRSNTISNSEMISYIGKLNYFCQEKNIPAISDALSMPQEKAKDILDINAFWVIDRQNDGTPDYVDYKGKYNVYDTVNIRMQDRLVIRAKLSVPQDLSLLKNGIFSFVNNNSIYKQRNDLRLLQINELLVRYNYDIEQLDSLQKIKYFEETKSRLPEKNGQMIFLQEQKTQLIYDDIYTLYTRKQVLEQQKNIYPDLITLISDFNMPAVPYTRMLYYGKVIIPLVFGLTIILLILIANRKRIKDLLKNY
jgi:hypothetical protein